MVRSVDELFAGIPNLIDDNVPEGDDDTQNEEVSKWGDINALPKKLDWDDDFDPKWHDDVALGLDGYKSEEAVKMSGARFVSLSGPVARLERAPDKHSITICVQELHVSPRGDPLT